MDNKKVVCCDLKGNRKEVSVDKLSFRPSVYAVIIKDNKVLLVRQWDGYDFPGGGLDIGETIDEALKREAWEETGLKIIKKEIVTCETSFFTLPFVKKHIQSILIYFLCDIKSGKITDKNLDEYEKEYAKKAEWVDIDKIKEVKFYNTTDSVKIIERAVVMIK